MKAIVCTEYGPPEVLKLKEVEKPVPGNKDVSIKINAIPVNYGDLLARNMKALTPGKFNMPFPLWLPTRLMFGFGKPKKKILGSEFAGEIEAVGEDVKQFKPGEKVFGYLGMTMGTNAQFLCMPETGCLTQKPSNMSDDEAAGVPYGAITSLNLLRKAEIQPGQKVLINGASGGIGSYAVQIAVNHFGAEVTGVCSTPRIDFVKSLGASKVIDYTREDFTKSGETYDLIFDILGRSSFSACKRSLTENGRYLLASFKMKQIFQMIRTSMTGGKKVICALAPEKTEDLVFVKKLVEEGKIRAIIDKRFPMEQTADAHRYIEEGNKKGNIIILVDHN